MGWVFVNLDEIAVDDRLMACNIIKGALLEFIVRFWVEDWLYLCSLLR
jgi:hypothetical protein